MSGELLFCCWLLWLEGNNFILFFFIPPTQDSYIKIRRTYVYFFSLLDSTICFLRFNNQQKLRGQSASTAAWAFTFNTTDLDMILALPSGPLCLPGIIIHELRGRDHYLVWPQNKNQTEADFKGFWTQHFPFKKQFSKNFLSPHVT